MENIPIFVVVNVVPVAHNLSIIIIKMKQRLFLSLAATVCLMLMLVACNDRPVAPAQLPAPIQSFVQQHFPGQTISYAQKDISLFGTDYEVLLMDGTTIDFDRKNLWDKIDGKMMPLPATVIPPAIANHVATNFPSIGIVKIDKERYGYDVELANDIELKFNKQGALIGMDD